MNVSRHSGAWAGDFGVGDVSVGPCIGGFLFFFLQGIINTCARCCRRYKGNPHNLLHLGLNLDKSGVDQTLYTRQAVFYGRTVSLYSAIIVEVKR